jgi:peptidyl-tRNA hydrolase, PTH1 family
MIHLVGLGNPGPKYENTRHNIGFMVIDELARKFSKSNFRFSMDKKSNALILETKFNNLDLLLVKPQTEMNASGYAIRIINTKYQILNTNLWVIHDDLDLPLGKLKITVGHGSAGHHGIDSIVEQLDTQDFIRFRVGIGHPVKIQKLEAGSWKLEPKRINKYGVIDFVLEEFQGKEAVEADKMIKKTAQAVELALKKDIKAAMNQYNK